VNGQGAYFRPVSESYRLRWESMAAWNSLSDRAAGANIKSINEMEIVRTKSLTEIKARRDEMLVKILKVIQEGAKT